MPDGAPMPDTDRWMTVAEAAQHFRYTEATVRRWINTGKLPAVKHGRVFRIRESAFVSMIEGRDETSGPVDDAGEPITSANFILPAELEEPDTTAGLILPSE